MSGHGNWDTTLSRLDLGLGESKSAGKQAPGVQPIAVTEVEPEPSGWPSFKPRNVAIKALKIEWIENLPGGSGGGSGSGAGGGS